MKDPCALGGKPRIFSDGWCVCVSPSFTVTEKNTSSRTGGTFPRHATGFVVCAEGSRCVFLMR